MIPIRLEPEPAGFDKDVRQKGHNWLRQHEMELDAAPPDASAMPPYWRIYNEQLYDAYSGVCAYLAFYFEFVSGAATTDHFIAKSSNAGDAYDWNNYRLSCLGANQRKNKYEDILDPFNMFPETFRLNLLSGEITVNQNLSDPNYIQLAKTTIDRLNLNSERHKKMRKQHFDNYCLHNITSLLQKCNPFVYYEAQRQGLL